MKTILTILFLCLTAQAEPITLTQDPKPEHSRIVVIDGEKKILLPSGRIIPFGQSQQCEEECFQWG